MIQNETGQPMSDDEYATLLNTQSPDKDSIIKKGNITAHQYTLEAARSCTSNQSLITILNLLSKGEKASSTIEDATDRTVKCLSATYSSPNNRFVFPTLITLLIFIRRNRQLTVRRPQAPLPSW